MYKNNTLCKLGCIEPDSLDHCFRCAIVDSKSSKTSVSLLDTSTSAGAGRAGSGHLGTVSLYLPTPFVNSIKMRTWFCVL